MANDIKTIQVLQTLIPGHSNLAINPSTDAVVDWLDNTPVSNEDIEAERTRLQAIYDAEQWKRNRQAEYPRHNDCIHALLDGGDTLTELQAKRQATKLKFPKP